MYVTWTLRVLVLCAGLPATLATAQAPHDHEHGKPAEYKTPTTYKDAVKEIRARLHVIDELITQQQLADVHAQAEVIQKVGDLVGQLALRAGSGVPKAAVKEVNKAGRDLAAKFDAIDKAGDSGDAAGTKKVYVEMMKLADVLSQYVPKEFACPMRCEDDKTYDKAVKCPKCGMELQDVNAHLDHNPKHGGTFFMAPDKKHHLEGTISYHKEFRVYFYDEYTKPILAGRFTAEGTAWTQGKDAEQKLALRPEPNKGFLTATIDTSVAFPIRIKIFIDFQDKQGPQVFDFEFAEPSKEPAALDTDGHEQGAKPKKHDKLHRGPDSP